MTKDDDPIYNRHEAAKYMRIQYETLKNWACKNSCKGPSLIKVGRLVFYRKSALDEFMESHTILFRNQ